MDGIRIGDLPFLEILTPDPVLRPIEKKNETFKEALDALVSSAEHAPTEQEAVKLQSPLMDAASEETVAEKLKTCPECNKDKPDVENRDTLGRPMCKDCYNKLVKRMTSLNVPDTIVSIKSPSAIGKAYER